MPPPENPALLDMPDEVLVKICEHLEFQDKAAFVTCNRHLLHLGDTAVPWQAAVVLHPATGWQLPSLRRWLLGKRAVLRRLLLVVKEIDSPPEQQQPADANSGKALLAELSVGGLRALSVGLHAFDMPPRGDFALGGWLLAFPQLRFLTIDSGWRVGQTAAGVACLRALTALRSLCIHCDWTERGGLGVRGQPPFLPASLTNLAVAYVAWLPPLGSLPRLRRLAVDNTSEQVFPFPLDPSGLEAATGLTALMLKGCCGLTFGPSPPAAGCLGSGGDERGSISDDSNQQEASGDDRDSEEEGGSSGGYSSGSEEPDGGRVPLEALPLLEGLSLQGSLNESLFDLPLSTTRLKVLNICANPTLDRIPLAPAAAASLQRLCCDLRTLAGGDSRELLGGILALAEVDVLWRQEVGEAYPTDVPMLRQLQEPALATLRAMPACRLVALEDSLAAALTGFDPASLGAVSAAARWQHIQAAAGVTQAAWAQQLPRARVASVHKHLGEGRRLPDFDRPEWDKVEV